MPIAMHLLIGHDLPYWPMRGNWHGLVKIAAKRHHHEQQCEAAGATPSLLQIIKNNFINNTHFLNAQFNIIIKIYEVQLIRYF